MNTTSDLSRKNFWTIVLNSTSAFVLAYLMVFYINHFTKIFIILFLGHSLRFNWYQIYLLIQDYQWTHGMVNLIFSAGVILVLVAGLVAYRSLLMMKFEQGIKYTFILWVSLLSFQLFFSELLIGTILTKGMGYVFQWMYLSDTAKVVIAMIGFGGLIIVASIMKGPVLWSSGSYFVKLTERNYPFFITAQIILPFIFGNLLSIIYFYPDIGVMNLFSWIPIGVTLLIMFLIVRHPVDVDMEDNNEMQGIKINKTIVIMAVVLVLLLRIALNWKITLP
ncbi:MAG: hypothetical protein JXR65_12660 [Bacteroidales bacterium]|nr:hypothetical protein [Bacteroidales bacterium]